MLIILAGITLNAVIGENGIILQAKDTKNLITNEITYDNQQLAQLQNELKDNGLYSGIGIIPGTDTGGGSEGGENGIGGGNQGGQTNQGSNTNTGTGGNSSGGDSQNQNATVKPINTQNQNPGGGTLVGGKTDEDPLIYVVSGEEIAASFYQSDVTIQIYTNDRSKKIKYILTTTVDAITNELYPSGLVRELDIENGGTLTFTKDGEYTITAYAYDTQGNKSNPTIMWFKRQMGTTTTGGITLSIASGKEGENKWYTSNVTLRVLGTDTGSKKIKYRVQGTATSTGQIGDKEVIGVGTFDSGEVEITNGTTFRIVADGEYTITAYSYDAGGMRLSQSEVLTLKKDATRPTIKSYTGEQIPGQGFKVTVNAEDTGAGLTNNAYTYRHRLAETNGDFTSEESNIVAKIYTGLNQQKTYDMYVMVTDEAGNTAITDVISKPSLWISNNPIIGEKVNNGTEGSRQYSRSETVALTFRGQDSNNVDIMKTTYQVLGTVDKAGSIAGNSVTVGQQLSDEYALNDKETRTIQLQADGNWTVKVHNYNKEGKLVTTNVVEVTRDITPPKITDFTRTARTTGTATVRAIVSEPTSGTGTTDGYTYYLASTSKSVQASNTYQYTGLTDIKTYTFKVIAKDKAGNVSAEKTLETMAGATKDFAYTGGAQQITLDAGKYKLEVWGAQGGDAVRSNGSTVRISRGGLGGRAVGDCTLANASIVSIYVGGAGTGARGSSVVGGFNGGGDGLNENDSNAYCAVGSGGGGTDMRIGGSSLINRVIVAGGGGGGVHRFSGSTTTIRSDGGSGGGLQGGASTSKEGTILAGANQNAAGTNGGLGFGGKVDRGGGGGGGYYGGGSIYGNGGSGGSGYIGGVNNGTMENGVQSGNGKARITLIE